MSMWIRVLCTKPVGDLKPAELLAGIADRLPIVAPFYGEDDHAGALSDLRIESEGDAQLSEWRLFYGGDGRFIGVERWSRPEQVREEIDELRETLAECDEEGVDDVRELLDRVVEAVAFELKMSDCEGIGWPVAIAAAACVAARGEGIVQADGEGWMAPRGREIEHVLDGD